jgi:hypothetical protein
MEVKRPGPPPQFVIGRIEFGPARPDPVSEALLKELLERLLRQRRRR